MDEEASGRSIFWALTAIMLNAMLQDSYTGYMTTEKDIKASLWPVRSSPAVCIYDAIIELRLMFRSPAMRPRRRPRGEEAEPEVVAESRATGAIMKLASFVLGVFPQAVKLYSMSGIPLTQALATAFLIPSVLHMVRSFGKHSAADLIQLAESAKDERSVDRKATWLEECFGAHVVGLASLWYWISGQAHVAVSTNVINAIDWVHFLTIVVGAAYVLQHTAFVVAGLKPRLRGQPVILVLMFTNMLSIPGILQRPCQKLCERRPRLAFMLSLLASLSVVCYTLAYLIWTTARRILSRKQSPEAVAYDMTSVIADDEEPNLEEDENEHGDPTSQVSAENIANEENSVGPEPQQSSGTNEHPGSTPAQVKTTTAASNQQNTCHEHQASPLIPGSTNSTENDTKDDDDIGIAWTIIVWITCGLFLPIMILLVYSEIWDFGDREAESQSHTLQQGTVEEARPSTSQKWRRRVETLWRNLTWSNILRIAQRPFQFALKVVITLTWRVFISLMGLFDYMVNWCKAVTQRNPVDILMMAFGMVNMITLAVVYLCLFDGTGTHSPSWNSMLG